MKTIRATTVIDGPIASCFNASLNIEAEASAEEEYELRAIAGVTHGQIGLNETVTWRVRQFGIWITHTTLISRAEPPTYFQDRMIKGLFRTFVHDHFFRSLSPQQTEMRDQLSFSMPVLLAGAIAERLIIQARLETMLARRNAIIKQLVEQPATAS